MTLTIVASPENRLFMMYIKAISNQAFLHSVRASLIIAFVVQAIEPAAVGQLGLDQVDEFVVVGGQGAGRALFGEQLTAGVIGKDAMDSTDRMAREHERELEKWAHRLDQVPIFVGRRDELLTKSPYQYLVFLAAPRIVQQVLGWNFAV